MTSIARSFADWHEHARRNQARIEALRERDDLSPAPGARKTPLRRFRPALFAFAGSPTPDGVGRAGSDVHGPAQVRAGIATGSQAAVVKLASFAGGRTRIGALLNYQSREGQLDLEREDGSLVQGVEAIRQLAADWDDDPGRRKPSKDVLYFTASVGSSVSVEAVKAALAEAMEGHKYAWRIESQDGGAQIHVVASAASASRNERGQAQRLFDTNKSMNALHDRLDAAFSADVRFEERGWAHGVDGAARLLCRLSKDGQRPALASTGQELNSHEANWKVANAWKRSLRSQEQRDVAHIIISAKPGVDEDAFVGAARETLGREFAGRKYAFALHKDREHLHVHAVARLADANGERLRTEVSDLNRWRQTMAEEARARDIPMEAASQFEQAHAPAYKLRDVQRIARGNAPEHVRRRVDAVKTKAIHVPTRPEGRERARQAVNGWRALSETPPYAPEPPRPAGAMRLYRADPPSGHPHDHPIFTTDRAHAERVGAKQGSTRLTYLDVPKERRAELNPSDKRPDAVFLVPMPLAADRRELPKIAEAQVRPFRHRVETALARAEGRIETASRREPERPASTFRLYRADPPKGHPHDFPLFTTDRSHAERVGAKQGAINLTYVDVPNERRNELTPSRGLPETVFLVPPEIAAHRQPIVGDIERDIPRTHREAPGPSRDRSRDIDALQAALNSNINAFTETFRKGPTMANLDLMTNSYRMMLVQLDKLEGLAGEDERELVAKQRERVIEVYGSALETARRVQQARQTDRAPHAADTLRQREAARLEPTPPPPSPALNSTPAERQARLEILHERVDAEARRETRQSNASAALGENNPAAGDVAHPYRSEAQAQAARAAARSENNDPGKPMPASPDQSQAIQQARLEQQRVLQQAAVDRDMVEQERRFWDAVKEREREEQAERQREGRTHKQKQ